MRRAHGDPPAPMPAGESARHRNGGQHVISVNTLFWKILVTRVKRKMREGKILIPLRQLTAANSANQRRAPLPRRRRDASIAATSVTAAGMNGDFAPMRGRGGIETVVNAQFR
jgi:hypothetical protein